MKNITNILKRPRNVMVKYYQIKSFIRGIIPGIENVIMWLPVIWRDRWWDYSFLFSILKRKLEFMEEGFRKYGVSVRAEKDAKKMKICILRHFVFSFCCILE